jgi:hypothetical protein
VSDIMGPVDWDFDELSDPVDRLVISLRAYVRAQYPEGDVATIGLNYLSAREPLWLTLADVLASKILTGRTPKVLSALRFEAMEKQEDHKPIAAAGEKIDPAMEDFYPR